MKLYKYPDSKSSGVSYEKVRNEIGRDLDFLDNTATDLQDEIIGPVIIEGNRGQEEGKERRIVDI